MNQTPSIGRIVHYLQPQTDVYIESTIAAVITQVHPKQREFADDPQEVGLRLFRPLAGEEEALTRVEFSETPKPGCWSWPPRT